jgi:hypothetical protein
MVFHVMHGGLIAVKQCVFAVVERAVGLMARSNVVVRVAVFLSLLVMLFGGIVVVGGDNMMLNDAKCYRRRQGR